MSVLSSARSVGEVLAVLEERLGDGWEVHPWPAGLMVEDDLSGQVSLYSDRGVALEARQSAWSGADRGEVRRRQRGGLLTTTTVLAHWLYAVQTDAGSVSYRSALDAEASLLGDLIAPSEDPVRAVAVSAQRRATREGWVMGTITLQITHSIPLHQS